MRTVVVKDFGGPETAELIETELPAVGAGRLRIRVAAAAVHPADLLARSGALAGLLPERPHYALGWDLVGTVDAVGAEVTAFEVGDRVVALSDWFATLTGTQAEYVVLPAAAAAPAPVKATDAEAATLPLNGLTAAQALDLIGLTDDQTLLVTGGAGGVGGFAVELALGRGLRVIAVAGVKDQAFVTGLGAQWVERGERAAEAVLALVPGGVDGVLDTALVGSPLLPAVRGGGTFVNVFPPAAPVSERGIRVDSVGVHSDGARLAELSELVDQGELTLRPARTFAAAEVAVVHQVLAAGGRRGGVVLTF